MGSLVLDASVAISAVLEEDKSDLARAILLRVAEAGATVPNLWHLEVGHTLLIAERRRKIDVMRRQEIQTLLLDLPITVDPETSSRAMRDTAALATQYRLTVYDAAYLELSHRLELPLATFDGDLRRAARTLSVALV